MKARTLEIERIEEFASYLVNEEKSKNTIEKYIRDAKALLVHNRRKSRNCIHHYDGSSRHQLQ